MRMRDFYGDERRASSDEVDFGTSWRTQGEGPWRVIWLEATGELAAFAAGGRTTVPTGRLGLGAMLGGGGADEVVVLGVETELDAVKGALHGWEHHMTDENGLAWLAERAAELGRAR